MPATIKRQMTARVNLSQIPRSTFIRAHIKQIPNKNGRGKECFVGPKSISLRRLSQGSLAQKIDRAADLPSIFLQDGFGLLFGSIGQRAHYFDRTSSQF